MSDELVTSGVLDLAPPQRRTLVADQITQYLEREHKSLNEEVLAGMMKAFERSVTRQLMKPRMDRKGYESTTTYTSPCARKARFAFDGVPGEPVQARAMLKFLLGDLVELAVVGIAQLAGVDWSMNNRDLWIMGHDGVKVNVHPDGLVAQHYDDLGVEYFNGEIKSCDSRTFDRWLEQGGPGDDWGYLTQCSVETAAWREAGYPVFSTVFVAVSTGSRQGSIAEWLIPYDQKLVDAWHERRMLARGTALPPIPFQAEDETEYVKGKSIDPERFTHGEPVPQLDKNGKIHGWRVPTGRKIIPTMCGYCSYKQSCWPNAELDVVGGKPIWITKQAPAS